MLLPSGLVLVLVSGTLWFGAGVLIFIFIISVSPASSGSGRAFAEGCNLWLILSRKCGLGLIQVVH